MIEVGDTVQIIRNGFVIGRATVRKVEPSRNPAVGKWVHTDQGSWPISQVRKI